MSWADKRLSVSHIGGDSAIGDLLLGRMHGAGDAASCGVHERFGGGQSVDEVAGATRSVFGFFPSGRVADGVGARAVGELERIGKIAADTFDASEVVLACATEFGRHIHCANDADEIAHGCCGEWLFTPGDHLNECTVTRGRGEHQNYEPFFSGNAGDF